MAAAKRAVGWIGAGALVLAVVAGALAFVLAQSQPGHDFLLRMALRQLPGFVNGEVRVGSIRSDGVLRGFSLHAVSILDAEGRPLLELDSLQLRYSARDLLARDLVIVPARVWSPRVTIETLAPGEPSNVVRIFAPDRDPADPGAGPDFRLSLRGVEVHDGTFTFRMPVDGEGIPGGVTEEGPAGGAPLQVIRLSEVDALIAEAELLDPELRGERIRFERLSLLGSVLEEPFRLTDFRGLVERDGATVRVAADRLRFPGTEAVGTLLLDLADPAGVGVEAALDIPLLDLEDFRWLEPRLPEGGGALALRFARAGGDIEIEASEADLRLGDSRVLGDLGLALGDGVRLSGARLEFAPLHLSTLDPWFPEPLPLAPVLAGRVEAEGPLQALLLSGDLQAEFPGEARPPLAGAFSGTVHMGEDPGVTAFSLDLQELDYASLESWAPALVLGGSGSLHVVATGTRSSGFELRAELDHRSPGGDSQLSHLVLSGAVSLSGDEPTLALEGLVDPLSLEGLAGALGTDLPVAGDLAGPFTIEGPLSALTVGADLLTPAGRIAASGQFDARDPTGGYRVEGRVEDFRLHALFPVLPDSTVVSADFLLDGSGAELGSLGGIAFVEVRDSWAAGIPVDRMDLRVSAAGGRLRVEELELDSPVLVLTGTGELPLREGEPNGEIRFQWDVSSLSAFRPFLFGADPIAADTLTTLERQVLVVGGVDPDTLEVAQGIEIEGRVRGQARIHGAVGDLQAEAGIDVEELVYGEISLTSAGGEVAVRWRDEGFEGVESAARFEGLVLPGFAFASGTAEVDYGQGSGSYALDLLSGEGEAYVARGDFQIDSLGVDVLVAELTLDLQDVEWALQRPATVHVAGSAVRVEDFEMGRPGATAGELVRIALHGTLDREGESDFTVRAEGVDLDRVATILQTEALPSGLLSLEFHAHGPPASPLIEGTFAIRDFGFDTTVLSSVDGSLSYADRRLRTVVTGLLDGEPLLRLDGVYPVDLAFVEVPTRFPNEEIDLLISVDELPAVTVLSFLGALDEVQGSLDGEVRLRGRPEDLHPSGEVVLRGGSALLSEIGIRLTGMDAAFTLRDNGTLAVDGTLQSRGTARVAGTVDLSDLSDPGFSLNVSASGFQAVDRRDLSARIGGEVVLGGSMNAPVLEGVVRVEQGELFLEEFARSAEVIDLADPAFFDVVDTSFVAVRPAVEAAQNPFIQNLRVEVDLSLQRDFWLRSGEINVEIAGDLAVLFERSTREIILVGSLLPVRGTYATFGRQFQVEGGTVNFAGTPGINPTLDIDAVTRLRREGGEPLTISAHVGGTLLGPRVNLSTDAQPPIAESDLISYLLFGRPSYALASAENSTLQGALGAGVSRMTGTITAQLGTVVGRQIGFDYFSITQGEEAGGLGSAQGLSGSFAHTQIEVGHYLGPDLFLAVVLRPLGGLQGGSQAQLPGARLEWRFTDTWSMEGFVEDRFAREGASGFGELGLRLSKIFGLSLYREWGY